VFSQSLQYRQAEPIAIAALAGFLKSLLQCKNAAQGLRRVNFSAV
jgi:hypothetical protein